MTLIFGTRNQRSSATDERHLSRVCDNGICLSTLATSCVVNDIGNVLVDGEGLSSHGRLINGQKSVSRSVLLVSIIVFVFLIGRVTALSFELLEVGFVSVGVIVGADDAGISRNNLTIFDDDLQAIRFRRLNRGRVFSTTYNITGTPTIKRMRAYRRSVF